MNDEPQRKEADWADRPEVRRRLWIAMWVIAGLTIVAEIILRLVDDHAHAGKFWFFYGTLGFVSCAIMILIAKGMGYLVKRKPYFYGDHEAGEEDTNHV